MQLRYFTLFSLLVALALFVACGKGEDKQIQNEDVILPKSYISVGDSMIYGLACDGCSDSVLVLLPDSGGDPVYYNILEDRLFESRRYHHACQYRESERNLVLL